MLVRILASSSTDSTPARWLSLVHAGAKLSARSRFRGPQTASRNQRPPPPQTTTTSALSTLITLRLLPWIAWLNGPDPGLLGVFCRVATAPFHRAAPPIQSSVASSPKPRRARAVGSSSLPEHAAPLGASTASITSLWGGCQASIAGDRRRQDPCSGEFLRKILPAVQEPVPPPRFVTSPLAQ